jgi:hypothetical protein
MIAFYFPLNVVIVFSNPAVPKDFMISDANSNRSGSAVFQLHPNLQEHNRFVCLF